MWIIEVGWAHDSQSHPLGLEIGSWYLDGVVYEEVDWWFFGWGSLSWSVNLGTKFLLVGENVKYDTQIIIK